MSSVCFLFFLKNDFSKVNKILVLTFLSQEKDFEGLKTFLFCLFCLFFFSFIVADFFFFNAMFTTPVYNSRRRGRFVNSAFLRRNVLPQKTRATEPPCQHFIGRTTQQTFLVINLAS